MRRNLYLKGIEVEVHDDMTIFIYKYHMKQVETYAVRIIGTRPIGKTRSRQTVFSHRTLKALNGMDELMELITIKLQNTDYRNYRNDALKRAIHLPEDERCQTFVEVLKEGSFLVTCSWQHAQPVSLYENMIELYPSQKDGFIYVFTSAEKFIK